MKRANTMQERRQEWKDKYFNKYSNDVTRLIVLQKQSGQLSEELKTLKKKNEELRKKLDSLRNTRCDNE